METEDERGSETAQSSANDKLAITFYLVLRCEPTIFGDYAVTH